MEGKEAAEETEKHLQEYERKKHCGLTEAKQREHFEMREVGIHINHLGEVG